ncbi:MAG TPA: hypothetical protein VIV60_28220 [Polyangiaceae bacterium]
MLKPQDLAVLVHLCIHEGPWTYPGLAAALNLSASETHAAVKRAEASGLMNLHTRRPMKAELLEFLLHGVRYAFPVERGGLTRGMPTSYGAPPLRERMMTVANDLAPVWPDAEGQVRGEAWSPLYPKAVEACRSDSLFYEALALVDAIRGGRARERSLAADELKKRLS